MCMASVVTAYGQTIGWNQWDTQSFDLLKEILTKVEELDKRLNQPDCEDPEKSAWMREVERRLDKLDASNERTD